MGETSRARVFFLNPPFHPNFSRAQRSPGVIKSGTLYYPIWLTYAAGAVRKAGHEIDLVDAPASRLDREAVRDRLVRFRPDLVVVDTVTASHFNDVEVLDELKAAWPEAKYVFVGTHASASGGEVMAGAPNADGACRGEYDLTLVDAANRIAEAGDLCGTPGMWWREGERIVAGPDRPYLKNLDELPWAAPLYNEFLPIDRYFYSITQKPVVTLITGRGCPYKCTFCVYPQTMHGHGYRRRSAEDVVEEMLWIEREMPHVREIFFEDDTLTVDFKRVRRMCELIRQKGSKIAWTANSRCDVDLETLQAMKSANCRLLCVGVESGNQEILDNVQKRITLDRIEQFASDARRSGVMIHGCFMVGNRGETRQTMDETFELAKRLRFDTVQFFPLMVYPGTAAYEWARENGHLASENFREWLDDEGCHNCVVSRPGLSSDDLVRFCDEARRRYYLRPRYMAGKMWQVMRHPREMRRVLKAGRTLAKYLVTRG